MSLSSIYKKIDKKLGGILPGGYKKPSGITIKIPKQATITTPTGETLTAREDSSGKTSVTSSTGRTKYVSVGGRGVSVSSPTTTSQTSSQPVSKTPQPTPTPPKPPTQAELRGISKTPSIYTPQQIQQLQRTLNRVMPQPTSQLPKKIQEQRGYTTAKQTYSPVYQKGVILDSGKQYFISTPKEIYSQSGGVFVSESPTGFQGTAYIRIPTPEEKIKIERAEYLGSPINLISEADKFLATSKKQKPEWIKKADTFVEEKLPPIPEEERPFFKPSNVKKAFDYAGELTLKGGEIGEKIVKKSGLVSESSWLFKPAPIKTETAKQLIGSAYMFAGFEPLMRTATAQVSQYADEVVVTTYKGKKIKVLRSDLEKYLKRPEVSGKTYKFDVSYSVKAERVRELLRNLKNPRDTKAVNEVLKVAQQTYGKDFIKDFVSQEFGVTTATSTTNVITSSNNLFFNKPTELKGISAIETSVSSFQPSKVGETSWVGDGMMDKIDIKPDQTTKQKIIPLLLPRFKTQQDQIPRQQTKQDTATDQTTKQIQTPKFAIPTPQITKQTPRLKQPQLQKPRLYFPRVKPKPKPKKPIPIPILSLPKRMLKKQEKEPELFEAFITKSGKEVSIGKAKTQLGAEEILKTKIVSTLGAGGFLEKGGKKLKATELKTFRTGEFRLSKVSPFKIIEKKGRRLRKGTTGKGIQMFRKSKGRNVKLL